jgi:heptosyltransferase-2
LNIPKQILIIQTAFIGDVILATPLIEAIIKKYPEANIDFFLRQGNEGLLNEHPYIRKTWVWNKRNNKYRNLFKLITDIRRNANYDVVINVQRFFATGLITALIPAKLKIGFDKNPLSFFYDKKVDHEIKEGMHEIERNLRLIPWKMDTFIARPKLYPLARNEEKISKLINTQFITVSPASVWFTKQCPFDKWIEFINQIPQETTIFLLGGPSDTLLCEKISFTAENKNIEILAGRLNFLESASLMQKAIINFVNDSAPMHLASSQNAPVCAVYCSTVPEFGFGPLSDFSRIVQVSNLACKPCGLHGFISCPERHFKCGIDLDVKKLLAAYEEAANFHFN